MHILLLNKAFCIKKSFYNKENQLIILFFQFFSEANEVESWMNEKTDILESSDFGKDEDAAVKLLTKHKVRHILPNNIETSYFIQI